MFYSPLLAPIYYKYQIKWMPASEFDYSKFNMSGEINIDKRALRSFYQDYNSNIPYNIAYNYLPSEDYFK